ncbi:Cytochrome P450 monooxygenase virE [Paramyrothecium foliicola]|nr:Cytochrome P450 monooxygenase virE [Paramyrothecium foliicola]
MALIAMINPLVALSIITAALLVWRIGHLGRRPRNLPPGPPTLPIIGNIHQMPQHQGHLQFQRWAQEHGPIYSLMLGTKVMVVLSSDQAVKDLLDRRSAIYSSRPEFYMGQQILSGGLRVLFMVSSQGHVGTKMFDVADQACQGYNETWRMIRKLAHTLLNVRVARTYVPYQDLENKAMLLGMLETPDDFINHIRRYTTSLTTQMTFGYRTPTSKDPSLLEMFDGAALLDVFPLLRVLPDVLLPVRAKGRKLHLREKRLFHKHLTNARKQLSQGTAKPCCCIDLIQLQKTSGFSDDLACYMSGSLLQAGSETTSAVLIGFFQAMVIFPEVARQAQEEIDRVCGNRIPDLNDVPDLPYIRSCVKESLRWMPTAPLGVPHAVTQDDYYSGYLIPKDAAVIVNVWAIQNDPQRHPDPRRFNPDRWKDHKENSADSAINPDATKRDHFIFGAGRRICQGMHIADRSLFLAIARTLWAFDFKRALDPQTNQEIVPDMHDLADGMFICPNPFKANIVPRNETKASLIKEEWSKSTAVLDEDLQWKEVPEGLIWRDYEPMGDIEGSHEFKEF